ILHIDEVRIQDTFPDPKDKPLDENTKLLFNLSDKEFAKDSLKLDGDEKGIVLG
ncbi:unnamed protein product, partial [marine sediment metagenome]